MKRKSKKTKQNNKNRSLKMKIKPKNHSMTFQDIRWIKFFYVISVGSITSLDLVTSVNVIVTRFLFSDLLFFVNRLNRICLCVRNVSARARPLPLDFYRFATYLLVIVVV